MFGSDRTEKRELLNRLRLLSLHFPLPGDLEKLLKDST